MTRTRLKIASEVRRVRADHRRKWKYKKSASETEYYAPTDFSDDLHINRAALMFGMVDEVTNEPKP